LRLSARVQTWDSSAGTPGATSCATGGASSSTFCTYSMKVRNSNGILPVRIWKRIAPRL
jgi:hypothetical protein